MPSIELDTPLIPLGLAEDGGLAVPPTGFPAGWFTGGPMPGQIGPAVIVGHVDWNGPGVFFRLREVRAGASVFVHRADGTTAAFRVVKVQRISKGAFPTAAVYGDLDHPGLRLITCGGAYDRARHTYEDNLVVYADLEVPQGSGG